MKKIFLYILAGSLCFTACKKDDDLEVYKEPEDINVQNNYDNQAIKKFMDENYLDVQGNIRPFSATDTADDKEKKLSQLEYETLPSGTIYIVRKGAQPTSNPQTIKSDDIIKIMGRAYSYVAIENNGNPSFTSKATFLNTIDGNVVPVIDPKYYFISDKDPLIVKATTDAAKQQSYYMIRGFNEALQKFKAFDNLPGEAPYNLQGVIIVPSRAAFARNPHYTYLGQSYRNASFVFNFQIYGRADRPAN